MKEPLPPVWGSRAPSSIRRHALQQRMQTHTHTCTRGLSMAIDLCIYSRRRHISKEIVGSEGVWSGGVNRSCRQRLMGFWRVEGSRGVWLVMRWVAELRGDICRAAAAAAHTCRSPATADLLLFLQNKSRVARGEGSPPLALPSCFFKRSQNFLSSFCSLSPELLG